MSKVTSNSADHTDTDSHASLEAEKLKEAADRAFAHYFPPARDKQSGRRNKFQLFTVCPDIESEALLANAFEDMLSISAIAADLADDVEGSRRSVALAISRMADGVQCWWSERWIITKHCRCRCALRPRFSRQVLR